MKIGSIVNTSLNVTRKLTVNSLCDHYDADHNTKATHSFEIISTKAINSVSINEVISAELDGHGKYRNDVVTLTSDFAECMTRALREIRQAGNVNFVHVKDLPHLLHTAVSEAVLCGSISDIQEAIVKFGVPFKHVNGLYEKHYQICCQSCYNEIRKPPVVLPVHWFNFYRTPVSVTEMRDCLSTLNKCKDEGQQKYS